MNGPPFLNLLLLLWSRMGPSPILTTWNDVSEPEVLHTSKDCIVMWQGGFVMIPRYLGK